MKPCHVVASKKFEKQLRRIPERIQKAVLAWIGDVEDSGIRAVRMRKGYHDEPLKGKRKGQRSVRLGRAYRLIYEEDSRGKIHLIVILEVTKHEY